MANPIPVFDSLDGFTLALGHRHETLERYLRLEVLQPDGLTTTGRPLFLADAASLERHRAAIRAHRGRVRARINAAKHAVIR